MEQSSEMLEYCNISLLLSCLCVGRHAWYVCGAKQFVKKITPRQKKKKKKLYVRKFTEGEIFISCVFEFRDRIRKNVFFLLLVGSSVCCVAKNFRPPISWSLFVSLQLVGLPTYKPLAPPLYISCHDLQPP